MSSIVSPYNWMEKAGARIEGVQMVLPFNFVLVPMNAASEAMVRLKKTDALNELILYGTAVAVFTRMADAAYFNNISRMLMERNPEWKICHKCIRGQLWPSLIVEHLANVNEQIIHKMERGESVTREDLECAEPYYESMFDHPMTNPILSCPPITDADFLSGKDSAEIDFAAAGANSATGGDGYCLVMERVFQIRQTVILP